MTRTIRVPSTTSRTAVNGNQVNTTAKILKAPLKQSTHFKYKNYIKNWIAYSKTMGKIELTHVLDFLNIMFHNGHIIQPLTLQKVLQQLLYSYHLTIR